MFLVAFEYPGWEDCSYWKMQDCKTLKKIDTIIKELFKSHFEGLRKSDLPKGNLFEFLSRRIDDKNRIVYKIVGDFVFVVSCYGHYDDK